SISLRGTTRQWPGRKGRLDRKTTHLSSFQTNRAGSVPSMILVKIVANEDKPKLRRVSTPAAELVNTSKRYGEVQAVREVSFVIELGEVVAMLGPNGAGKTTSISLMLGTRKPTSGTARLFGMDPKDL